MPHIPSAPLTIVNDVLETYINPLLETDKLYDPSMELA